MCEINKLQETAYTDYKSGGGGVMGFSLKILRHGSIWSKKTFLEMSSIFQKFQERKKSRKKPQVWVRICKIPKKKKKKKKKKRTVCKKIYCRDKYDPTILPIFGFLPRNTREIPNLLYHPVQWCHQPWGSNQGPLGFLPTT